MNFSHEILHELAGHSARLTAILNLIRNPETRDSLDQAQVHRDVQATLKNFHDTWAHAVAQQKQQGDRQ